MIADTIFQKIAAAMKARDEIRLSTLRMLSSALNYEFIAKQHKLNEEEELEVVRHEAKKRKDAIEIYEKLKNSKTQKLQTRIQREKEELKILQEFLPPEMSDEELNQLVSESISQLGAKSMGETGKVMAVVMAKAKGKADGNRVSQLVKEKLNSL